LTNVLDFSRFYELWHRLGAAGDARPFFEELSAAYSEPHRAYHGAAHIFDCLQQFDAVRTLFVRPDEAEFALWFHDAVYDPKAADNEEKSAAWAAAALTNAGVSGESVMRISELILATKHSACTPEQDTQLVADIDLSILGREPDIFTAYDRAIRLEYKWVAEDEYREGRTRVLSRFLDRPAIFQSDVFRSRFEQQARVNLRRAIARLVGSCL
jgi:predicted metal-dependent HD superfamily phosphohydrolase